MKRNRLLTMTALAAFAGVIFTAYSDFNGSDTYVSRKKTSVSPGKEKVKGAFEAYEYTTRLRTNPLTQDVDPQDVMAAYRAADAMQNAANKTNSVTLQWQEMGPDNVGGRTRALIYDKKNPNRMYAGGVSGGLWYSNTAGTSWFKSNDMYNNLAVASICQAANGDVYFGTGEGMYFNGGAGTGGIQGQGIWKSTDGGATFSRLGSTWDNISGSEQITYQNVNRMVAHPTNANRIYASTKRGLRMTDDGGATWINPLGSTVSSSSDVDIAADGSVVAAIVGGRLYKSASGDNGSFTMITIGLPASGFSRLELAIAPSNPNYMYISASSSSTGGLYNVYQSVDKGENWAIIGPGGSSSFNPLGTQGSYDNALEVFPTNPQRIVLGGQTEMWTWEVTQGWLKLSPGVHPDMHVFTFHPNDPNILWLGCDGGLYRSTNAGNLYPYFQDMNKGYNVTQFYAVAMAPTGEVMGGTQDNGTQYIDFYGNTTMSARNINGGDGAYAEISTIDPQVFFYESQGAALVRNNKKGSGGGTSFYDSHINTALTGAPFITPFHLWERNNYGPTSDTSFFIGLNTSVWMTKGAVNFSAAPVWYKIANITGGGAQCMAASQDGQHLYVGTGNGNLYRISNLSYVRDTIDTTGGTYDLSGGTTPVNPKQIFSFAPRSITGIAVDPKNPDHIVVTLGNYGFPDFVYRSQDGTDTTGVSFAMIQNNLPAMPVYSAVIDQINGNRIILGTELGIWMSDDAGTTWSEQNNGMARVPAYMVRQQLLNDVGGYSSVLVVGTHGRGIFKSSTLVGMNDQIKADAPVMNVYPNPMRENGTISYVLRKSADVKVEIFDLQGKLVKRIMEPGRSAGAHTIKFDAAALNNGTYLLKFSAGETNSVAKFVVTK